VFVIFAFAVTKVQVQLYVSVVVAVVLDTFHVIHHTLFIIYASTNAIEVVVSAFIISV
jgi:hypothetical protein